jgi:hypothetical protein
MWKNNQKHSNIIVNITSHYHQSRFGIVSKELELTSTRGLQVKELHIQQLVIRIITLFVKLMKTKILNINMLEVKDSIQ